jgi:hypothetical protein
MLDIQLSNLQQVREQTLQFQETLKGGMDAINNEVSEPFRHWGMNLLT